MFETEDNFEYDRHGRVKAHPYFHPNQGKKWAREDLFYLCRYWDYASMTEMSYALGRTETSCASQVCFLKKNGHFYRYQKLWEGLK